MLVGKAIAGRRDKVFVSTKFGIQFDPETRTTTGSIKTPQDIINSCEDSLKRLGTDYIDLFLFHLGDFPAEEAPMVRDTLEKLVDDGKIRYYGWSTSDPARQEIFSLGKHYEGCEFALNVLEDDPVMCSFVEEKGITGLGRSPLAMGLLTGKYNQKTNFSKDDLRGKKCTCMDDLFCRWKTKRNIPEKTGKYPRDPYLKGTYPGTGLSLLDAGKKRQMYSDPRI